MSDHKIIFDTVRPWLDNKGFTSERIAALDDAIYNAMGISTIVVTAPEPAPIKLDWRLGPAGEKLIHSFEDCKLEAYPDPGSKDGHPWAIGWGSTGPGIGPGVVWTQAECDARFARDVIRFVADVVKAIGSAPTTQNQFDALVSFHYNTGAIGKATLTKKHVAGDYAGAQAEFGKWVYNDGKVMRGLTRRRAAEAALYGTP